MKLEDIKGNCHAHITIAEDSPMFICPKGWKITIIVLNNAIKTQKDLIITRHFAIGSNKTPELHHIYTEVRNAMQELVDSGIEILRAKLEHESMPSFEPSAEHYRECHIKMHHPKNMELKTIPGYVSSRNIVEDVGAYAVAFLSARYYTGSMESVDFAIDSATETLKLLNPEATVVSVHKESIVFDTNPEMDKWWA